MSDHTLQHSIDHERNRFEVKHGITYCRRCGRPVVIDSRPEFTQPHPCEAVKVELRSEQGQRFRAVSGERRTTEPHDRLTRICDEMTRTFDGHPEHRNGDRCIVFLDDGERGGLVLHGYDDDTDAMADLLVHVRAVFRANGKDLQFIAIPDDAGGLTGP